MELFNIDNLRDVLTSINSYTNRTNNVNNVSSSFWGYARPRRSLIPRRTIQTTFSGSNTPVPKQVQSYNKTASNAPTFTYTSINFGQNRSGNQPHLFGAFEQ